MIFSSQEKSAAEGGGVVELRAVSQKDTYVRTMILVIGLKAGSPKF